MVAEATTLLTFDYPPMSGGIARFCESLVNELRLHRPGVNVLTHQTLQGTTSATRDPTRIEVVHARPLREASALARLILQQLTGRTGILVCGNWYPEGVIAWMSGFRPFVVLAHGAEIFPAPRGGLPVSFWRTVMNRVLTGASLVVANSEYTRALVSQHSPACNSVALPLAVDTRKFSPGVPSHSRKRLGLDDDCFVMTTVARLDSHKGHLDVMRAARSLLQQGHSSFCYVISGTGPEESSLREHSRQWGLEQHVRFLGQISDETLVHLYRASDVTLLCSHELARERKVEGFGLVLLESQSCGTPAIAYQSGGMTDAVVHGTGGWTVPAGNVGQLSELLATLVQDSSLVRQQGALARSRVEEECTWTGYTERFLELTDRYRHDY